MTNRIAKAVAAGMLTLGGWGFLMAPPTPAHAAACVGVNEEVEGAPGDPASGAEPAYEVKVDSCGAQDIVNAYADGAGAAGAIGGIVGAKVPAAGAIAGGIAAWSVAEQAHVRDCAAPGTGISFIRSGGVIIDCHPQ